MRVITTVTTAIINPNPKPCRHCCYCQLLHAFTTLITTINITTTTTTTIIITINSLPHCTHHNSRFL